MNWGQPWIALSTTLALGVGAHAQAILHGDSVHLVALPPNHDVSRLQQKPLDRKPAIGGPRYTPSSALLKDRGPDHRREGALLGAILLGAGGAILAQGFCDYDGKPQSGCFGRTVGGGVIGAVAGFIVGGLIGGLIPKNNPTPRPDASAP